MPSLWYHTKKWPTEIEHEESIQGTEEGEESGDQKPGNTSSSNLWKDSGEVQWGCCHFADELQAAEHGESIYGTEGVGVTGEEIATNQGSRREGAMELDEREKGWGN